MPHLKFSRRPDGSLGQVTTTWTAAYDHKSRTMRVYFGDQLFATQNIIVPENADYELLINLDTVVQVTP